MDYNYYKETVENAGVYVASLIANMSGVPLPQTQLWMRRVCFKKRLSINVIKEKANGSRNME